MYPATYSFWRCFIRLVVLFMVLLFIPVGSIPDCSSAQSCIEGTEGHYVEPWPTIEVNGEERTYRLYIPTCRDPARQRPLVIFIHGLCGQAEQQAGLTGLTALAEREDFILVYAESSYKSGIFIGPCTVDEAGNPKWWGVGPQTDEELEYFRKVIDQVKDSYQVDEQRIYGIGHSNGGHMIYQLANDMSETFAALASFAGAPFLLQEEYSPQRQIPFVLVQGTADEMVDPALVEGYKEEIRAFNNAADETIYYSIDSGDSLDRKSTRLNSSHTDISRMPSSA